MAGCHLSGIELLESGPILSSIIPVGSYLVYIKFGATHMNLCADYTKLLSDSMF